MEQNQNDHDFRIAHPVGLVPMLTILDLDKFFAKIIRHTINLRDFNY